MDVEKMVRVYIKIRDKSIERQRAFDEEQQALKTQMAMIEGSLLQHLHNTNSESVRTDAGTFYRQEDIKPSGTDWDALYRWIAENNEFEALERRIKKTFVKEYMDTHDGAVPPGVAVHREHVVRVRRA